MAISDIEDRDVHSVDPLVDEVEVSQMVEVDGDLHNSSLCHFKFSVSDPAI